jgi:pyrimidine-nucleoside phosphorylase
MRAVDLIVKKREGDELTRDEINYFVRGYTEGEIPDYQAAAWLMAICCQGMSRREIADLTTAMAQSGDMLDLGSIPSPVVDKHSTGGVGDKVSLVVVPLVASLGLTVAKMSGRGLGFTGGTLDKLESINGFRADLTTEEFLAQVRQVGAVITGQTLSLAPADGKLYALRDVTGTVSCLPLIASSIMSKKLASGAQAIVLDVKVGKGAFMETVEEALRLAEMMVEIGYRAERQVTALISDMNQPLGWAVGNALELREAIDTLHEGGPRDFRQHCLVVAAELLQLVGVVNSLDAGLAQARGALSSGKAWEQFVKLVEAQGGDTEQINDPDRLPHAKLIQATPAPRNGYLAELNAREVGLAAMELGAGRTRKGESVDHAVGIVVHYKVGDYVEKDTPLFTIHANDQEKLEAAEKRLLKAHLFSAEPVEPFPLFYRRVSSSSILSRRSDISAP